MKKIILNANKIFSFEQIHDKFANGLKLDAHYGRNLDALWDVLGERSDVEILLINEKILRVKFGEKAQSLISLLNEISTENKGIKFKILS